MICSNFKMERVVVTARISGINKGGVYSMEQNKAMELLRYCINHGTEGW